VERTSQEARPQDRVAELSHNLMGRARSALPRWFRHPPARLLPKHHPLRSQGNERCFRFSCGRRPWTGI